MEFIYRQCKVKDLIAHVKTKENGHKEVTEMEVEGRKLEPTQRFWTSLQSRFSFSNNIFKYFDHKEVFDRISDVAPNDDLRYVIEKEGDRERLLAVTNPRNVAIQRDDLLGLLKKHGINTEDTDQVWPRLGGSIDPHGIRIGGVGGPMRNDDWQAQKPRIPELTYNEGIVRSVHTPRNSSDFKIAGDDFSNKFVMDTPIDGFGKPSIYLMLLRQICANGSIGYSSVFRSEIALGKGESAFDYALTRAIEGYNNEDGYNALRARFEAATKSWSSVAEINRLYKLLARLHHRKAFKVRSKYLTDEKSGSDGAALMEGSPIIKSFHAMVGDLQRTYGLANLDALSVKRQRTLPAGCRVYEMLNFVSETATHYAKPEGSTALQAFTGDMVASEYDLEGTLDKFGDWRELLISDESAVESLAIAQQK